MARQKIKTAAYRLFHYRYEMLIPEMFKYGQAYLEKHGYHVSGDGQLDRERLMEMSVVMQTPAGIAMMHDEGAPFDVVNPADAVAIYEDIQEHLRDWERQIGFGVHPDSVPPLEQFRQLETVAMALYASVKFYEPNQPTGDPLRERLMALNRQRNPVHTERYLRRKITDEHGNLKPYVSIVDRMERALYSGSGDTWR